MSRVDDALFCLRFPLFVLPPFFSICCSFGVVLAFLEASTACPMFLLDSKGGRTFSFALLVGCNHVGPYPTQYFFFISLLFGLARCLTFAFFLPQILFGRLFDSDFSWRFVGCILR